MSISWGKVTIIHKNPLILGISPCSNLQKPTLLLKLVSKAPQFLAPRNGFGQSFNSFLMAGRGSDMGILTNILLTNKYRETMRNMHQPFHEDLNIWCMNNNKQQYLLKLLNGILSARCLLGMPKHVAQIRFRKCYLNLLRRFISLYAHAKAIQPPIIQICEYGLRSDWTSKNSCRLRWIIWNHDWNRH